MQSVSIESEMRSGGGLGTQQALGHRRRTGGSAAGRRGSGQDSFRCSLPYRCLYLGWQGNDFVNFISLSLSCVFFFFKFFISSCFSNCLVYSAKIHLHLSGKFQKGLTVCCFSTVHVEKYFCLWYLHCLFCGGADNSFLSYEFVLSCATPYMEYARAV